MKTKLKFVVAAITATFAGSALAAVSAEEAKQLGTTLTPWGAEKAGNKEGTIPAYTGEATKVPASYDRKEPGQKPDPFNEKPLFSITAQNYTKYADKLDGMVEMFKRYPNYRMDIYPTHRNWTYPKYVIDNTLKNATSCKAIKGELALDGCYGGYPFPIPKTGNQAMWNHMTLPRMRTIGEPRVRHSILDEGEEAIHPFGDKISRARIELLIKYLGPDADKSLDCGPPGSNLSPTPQCPDTGIPIGPPPSERRAP